MGRTVKTYKFTREAPYEKDWRRTCRDGHMARKIILKSRYKATIWGGGGGGGGQGGCTPLKLKKIQHFHPKNAISEPFNP